MATLYETNVAARPMNASLRALLDLLARIAFEEMIASKPLPDTEQCDRMAA